MSQDKASKDNDDNNLANNQMKLIKNGDNLIGVKEANDNKMKYNAPNTLDNSCCNCTEKTKFWLRIIFCPYYFVYNIFGFFWERRYQTEPFYQSGLFKDNVIFFFLSIIDMILVIIYKGQLSILFFVIRDDEDHMEPACGLCTVIENVITVGLDITSIVLFFISDFKSNIILLISLIAHLVFPIIFPFINFYCDN